MHSTSAGLDMSRYNTYIDTILLIFHSRFNNYHLTYIIIICLTRINHLVKRVNI